MHFYSENIISTFLVSIFKKGGKKKQNFISICFAVFVLMSNAQRLNLTAQLSSF